MSLKTYFIKLISHSINGLSILFRCGLNLYGVDGVVWRTPESKENSAAFSHSTNKAYESSYPQVHMVCMMELGRHLIVDGAFSSITESEVNLADNLIDSIPENSLPLFDKDFY